MTPFRITQRAAAGTLERRGTLRRAWPIAALLLLSPPIVVTAQELGARDQINVGIAKSASPQVRRSAEAEKALRVEPTRTFEYADHVANGIAMRNRTAGTFTCAALQCQGKCSRLSSISTSRTGRETASGTCLFFSTPIGSLPTRLAITMIHAGE
jgi:hypothetical protein